MQEPLVLGPDRAGEEHQQVDVRVEAQLAAAVAAEGEDADRLDRAGRGSAKSCWTIASMRCEYLLQRVAPALAPLGRGRSSARAASRRAARAARTSDAGA